MANKELELALRLKTDLEQGRREVVDLADAVEGVGTSAQDANRDLSKLGSGNDAGKAKTTVDGLTESVRQVGATAEASSASLAQVGETAEQQATRIRAMVSASLQQQQANEQAAASCDWCRFADLHCNNGHWFYASAGTYPCFEHCTRRAFTSGAPARWVRALVCRGRARSPGHYFIRWQCARADGRHVQPPGTADSLGVPRMPWNDGGLFGIRQQR